MHEPLDKAAMDRLEELLAALTAAQSAYLKASHVYHEAP